MLVSTCTTPVPLAARVIPTFVSPDAVIVGAPPEAALAKVNSLTAELVAVNKNNSFPLESKIEVTTLGAVIVDVFIAGAVKVLFVKVSEDTKDTKVESAPAGSNITLVTLAE